MENRSSIDRWTVLFQNKLLTAMNAAIALVDTHPVVCMLILAYTIQLAHFATTNTIEESPLTPATPPLPDPLTPAAETSLGREVLLTEDSQGQTYGSHIDPMTGDYYQATKAILRDCAEAYQQAWLMLTYEVDLGKQVKVTTCSEGDKAFLLLPT